MPTATERLAEIAHDLWREDLERRGWVRSPEFEAASKRHDALVPFDAVDKHDRRQALLGIQALDLESQLIGSIWYERGPARLFTVEEMRKGLRVAFNTAGISRDTADTPDGHPTRTGEIIDWAIDGDGWLCSITVRWSDGSTVEHHPAWRELKRIEEGPSPTRPPCLA